MGQHLVLVDQGCGCNLCHHESRIQPCAWSEKGWKAFVERRIHQPFQPPLRNSCQRIQGHSHEVQSEREWFPMEVAAGKDIAFDRIANLRRTRPHLLGSGKYQWVVHCRVHFYLKDSPAMGDGIAHRAMDLWDTTQRIGVLHLAALAMRLANRAALQHPAQVVGYQKLTCMRPCRLDALVESDVRTTQCIYAKRANHVRRVGEDLCL